MVVSLASAFALVFGDFEDMDIDFYRFVSIGAIMSSPVVDRGVVYAGSMDGKLYGDRVGWAGGQGHGTDMGS